MASGNESAPRPRHNGIAVRDRIPRGGRLPLPSGTVHLPDANPPADRQDIIYFVEGAGLVKIGTTWNLSNRMDGLQAHCPVPLTLIGWMPGDASAEQDIHRRFISKCSHNEWFVLDDELRAFVALCCESQSFNVTVARAFLLHVGQCLDAPPESFALWRPGVSERLRALQTTRLSEMDAAERRRRDFHERALKAIAKVRKAARAWEVEEDWTAHAPLLTSEAA